MSKGWIGVDLDRTLAEYTTWKGETHIGKPIPMMVERIKAWLKEGKYDVKIFTARASGDLDTPAVTKAIHNWLKEQGLPELEVTCVKDYHCVQIWDDRAVQVIANTGEQVCINDDLIFAATKCKEYFEKSGLGHPMVLNEQRYLFDLLEEALNKKPTNPVPYEHST